MPNFKIRSQEKEMLDDLMVVGDDLEQNLKELHFINTWLGGYAITTNGIDSVLKKMKPAQTSKTFIDFGSGGGDLLIHLASNNKYSTFRFIGIDANPNIIDYAEKNSKNYNSISYTCCNILELDQQLLTNAIVSCNLFLHHFAEDDIVAILKKCRENNCVVIINDLHRNFFAYHSIDWLTRIFSKSKMVKNDAKLSVHRGFSKNELKNCILKSGYNRFEINWKWAFRWQCILFT